MSSILFEGTDDLKISSFNKKYGNVKISMSNNLLEAEYSLLEINLSADEINELYRWIDRIRDEIRQEEYKKLPQTN